MNCQTVRNRILSLPDPRQVPDALRGHVDSCPECARWWQHAARLERLLAELPAPPAPEGKKEALIDELTAAGPVIKAVPALAPRPGLAALRRNWKPVAGLAAAVLVAVGGWQVWPRNGGTKPVATATPQDPFVKKLVERFTDLSRAPTAEKRLEGLGAVADELSAETRTLARVASPDDLKELAGWYDKVVAEGIVRQAEAGSTRTLTPTERKERAALLNGLAGKLDTAARETEAVAEHTPPDRKAVLQRIVDRARSGQQELRRLADQGT